MTTREPTEAPPTRVGGERREAPPLDETKHAVKTVEFWAFVALLVGLIVAGAVLDGFDPGRVWLYVTILAVGYMVSRGIAKSLRGRGRGQETKDSYKTTEFLVFVAALIGLLVAGALSDGQAGGEDNLEGARVWLLATILGVGYMVSRGLAKSGAGARAHNRRERRGGDPKGAEGDAAEQEEVVDRSSAEPSGSEPRRPEVSAPEGATKENRQSALSAHGRQQESLQQPPARGSGAELGHGGAPAPELQGQGGERRGDPRAGGRPQSEGRRTSANLANVAITLGAVGLAALVFTFGALFFLALPLGLATLVLAGLASRRGGRPRSVRVRVAWLLGLLTSVLSAVALALVVLGVAVIQQLI